MPVPVAGLLAGRPLRDPLVSHGPFVMNTEQQISQAFERYRAGGMGSLTSEASLITHTPNLEGSP